jgi:hypothetical protein
VEGREGKMKREREGGRDEKKERNEGEGDRKVISVWDILLALN